MKFAQLLPNVTKMLSAIRLVGRRDPKLSRLDFGILEVALMVAALDGEILDSEYESFVSLAKKCRGYTAANAKKCLDAALRKGGYLMAIAKVGDYSDKERIDAFVDLAVEAMPRGFVDGELSDLRRAFVLWVAMGVSDGEFSGIERSAVDALQDRFAQVMLARAMDEEQRWVALVPSLQTIDGRPCAHKISLLEKDFLDKAEALVKNLSVASKRDKAEAALAEFIG